MHLGILIKKYRKQNDLSMDDFAERSGLSKAYISMLERNENSRSKEPIKPSFETMIAVANTIGLDVNTVIEMLDPETIVNLNEDKPVHTHKETYLRDFGIRLKTAREARSYSQQELADKIGTSKSMISAYENGITDPRQSVIPSLADTLDVSISWLIKGEDEYFDINAHKFIPVTTHKIPLLGNVACGKPKFADEDLETYVDPGDIGADFALRCTGDSMVGAGIYDGDIAYIRKQSDVQSGEIGVVLIGEEATLKRVYKYETQLELHAENPNYPALVFKEEESAEIRILGKLVGYYHSVEE